MKVLYVAPHFPNNGETAAEVRLQRILPRLNQKVELKVFGFSVNRVRNDNCQSTLDVIPVKRTPITLGRGAVQMFSRWPQTFARHCGAETVSLFRKTEQEFQPDIVHYDTFGCVGLARYSACRKSVFHVHDAISKKYAGWCDSEKNWLKKAFLAFQKGKVQYAERKLFPTSAMCVVDSEEDAELLRQETGANVSVVALGFEDEIFRPEGSKVELPFPSIVFSGSMATLQTLDAVRWLVNEIMPIVWQQLPEAQVYLAGANPQAEIISIAERQSRVHLTGFVDDLAAYLRSATVYACPLRIGSGMKTRVVEALATGCPMVSTAQGVAGLEKVKDSAWKETDDPREFADSIVHLINNEVLRGEAGKKAAAYAKTRYTWENTATALFELYVNGFSK